MKYDLFLGDCLDVLPSIPDGRIDCVITDLPYGVTNRGSEAGRWDKIIPLEPMWERFLRVTKENAAIILFSSGMFTAKLMTSKPSLWKYNLL